MSTETGVMPLAVWDTCARDSFFCRSDDSSMERFWQAIKWAERHIDRPEDTYRVEFYLVDCPSAIVYRFATDDRRRIRFNYAAGEPFSEDPVTVMLDELPPEHLWES